MRTGLAFLAFIWSGCAAPQATQLLVTVEALPDGVTADELVITVAPVEDTGDPPFVARLSLGEQRMLPLSFAVRPRDEEHPEMPVGVSVDALLDCHVVAHGRTTVDAWKSEQAFAVDVVLDPLPMSGEAVCSRSASRGGPG